MKKITIIIAIACCLNTNAQTITAVAGIGAATNIPVSQETPVISLSPVVLKVKGRAVDLQVRVSAPTTGRKLPIIILSHGHGMSNNLSSLNGYGPLANFWAAHGFVVIQPTHQSSKTLSLDPKTPGAPLFWRSRAEDIKSILDQLDAIEASFPEIKGRLDRSRIAVAGVSMGALTASMLLGARVTDANDPKNATDVDISDPRIKVGVILSGPGKGGADLAPVAAKFSYALDPSFDKMTTPALVVMGDKDSGGMTVRDASWHSDPYFLSNGPKCLLTLFGGKHLLGGVSGYDAAETSDENPERVALVQRLTWAYLRTALYPEDSAWSVACKALAESANTLGKVECK
jgi:hypothetical protein